jgi:hypothetical protein
MNTRTAPTILAMALLFVLAVPISSEAQSCGNGLIQGTYGFTIDGQKFGPPNTPTGPQAGVALTRFDGHGRLTQTDTVTINGQLVAHFTHPTADGQYSVNSDCTGTFTITFHDGRPPVTANFVVVSNGDEIDTVVIPPTGAVGFLATRSIGKRTFKRED